jgi:hypothetical protein
MIVAVVANGTWGTMFGTAVKMPELDGAISVVLPSLVLAVELAVP